MIAPTVGRIVWYRPSSDEEIPKQADGQPLAAIVAMVWPGGGMVNLSVFDANGFSRPRSKVPLVQENNEAPSGSYCEWMPYQKGQAAKTEALEAALKKESSNG